MAKFIKGYIRKSCNVHLSQKTNLKIHCNPNWDWETQRVNKLINGSFLKSPALTPVTCNPAYIKTLGMMSLMPEQRSITVKESNGWKKLQDQLGNGNHR